MIEDFKTLEPEDTILFTDNQVIDFFEEEEMTVTGVRVYSLDDTEMVIVEMEDFCLVAHNFETEEKFFVYQLIDEGDTGDLEDEGYKFLNDEDDFRHKIVIREDGKASVYHPSDTGAIYGLTREKYDGDEDGGGEPQEVSICEFQSSSARLSKILIEREDDRAYILQGFEINDDSFELPEIEEESE